MKHHIFDEPEDAWRFYEVCEKLGVPVDFPIPKDQKSGKFVVTHYNSKEEQKHEWKKIVRPAEPTFTQKELELK